MRGNSNNDQPTPAVLMAGPPGPPPKLKARIRSLHDLWREYMDGLDGNKAARLFTSSEKGAVASLYSRRNAFWFVVGRMVRAGMSADTAIDKVKQTYGYGASITNVLMMMAKHRHLPNGAHANLVV